MPPRSRSNEDRPDETTPSESPTPSQSPPPVEDPTPSSPLFMPTRSPEQPLPPTEPESSPNPGADGPADAGSLDTSSARRSTGSTARERMKALRATADAVVGMAGGIAHRLLTRPGSVEREEQLWVPDEEDVEAIADPLASLASRRAPAGVENPDVTDLARLAIGVLMYFLKQVDRREAIQEYYAVQPPQGDPAVGAEPAADVDPWLVST